MISKIFICCDCLEKEVKVDPSIEQVVCPDCVQRRLVLLKKFGGAVFRKALYEEQREKRVELLKARAPTRKLKRERNHL